MRKLEELNLVDNFLANSVFGHKVYGASASKLILECVLRRKIDKLTVVPQYFFQGENVDKHGVRLDVYLDEENGEIFDIEPDQNDGADDVKSLPRRVRFYHAKIDAATLSAGEEYQNLRNVLVIFITTYDPFERNQMVYTIRNSCMEIPDLPYDDGSRTIFLYTKGTEGNPPEDLQKLLRYMEHSSFQNASTAALRRLHKMVTAVKQDGEVGFAYMKNFEIEQRIRKQGIQQGIQQGKQEFIKTLVLQKRKKGKDISQIADELEQSEEMIISILQELGETK